jgi:hypothetical protein
MLEDQICGVRGAARSCKSDEFGLFFGFLFKIKKIGLMSEF